MDTYRATQYLKHKKIYENALDQYSQATNELKTAREDWNKSRDRIRASVTEDQLEELVIKTLQDQVVNKALEIE